VTNSAQPDAELGREFQRALRTCLAGERVVSLFVRLHTLIRTDWLLDGAGKMVDHGSTVAIRLDAHRAEEGVVAQLSGNRRREIRKLREMRIRVQEDPSSSAREEFAIAYRETMRRAMAAERYYFDLDYFSGLKAALGERLRLFTARNDAGELMAAILVLANRDILQYHLSATPDRFVRESAVKLLIFEAALWGAQRGFTRFHLGGGVGASDQDGVFQFKKAFSPTTYPFRTARLVIDEAGYGRLCRAREAWMDGTHSSSESFFPLYRAPA
jgi:hypothetical protein